VVQHRRLHAGAVGRLRQRAAQPAHRPGLSKRRPDDPAAHHFGQRFAATLRWDIFNVFNTVNFGLPNRNVSDAATFGTISSLSSDARIMQIAARFTF
jgi:hypothetical protein